MILAYCTTSLKITYKSSNGVAITHLCQNALGTGNHYNCIENVITFPVARMDCRWWPADVRFAIIDFLALSTAFPRSQMTPDPPDPPNPSNPPQTQSNIVIWSVVGALCAVVTATLVVLLLRASITWRKKKSHALQVGCKC